jgi:rRNA maturation RNase YbeY
MSINFFNEDVDLPKIKKRNTVAWIKQVIDEHCKKVGDVSFIFCSDTYLLDVNKQYLDHDYFTDVITFDYVEGDVVSGDIFISVDRVEENAKSFSTSFSNELNRIIIHGILHLLGYNDKTDTDKLIMTGKEDLYLNLLNNN